LVVAEPHGDIGATAADLLGLIDDMTFGESTAIEPLEKVLLKVLSRAASPLPSARR
jgi:hypothetical protein